MAFGVLTTNSVEEALERAGEGRATKGGGRDERGGDGDSDRAPAVSVVKKDRRRAHGKRRSRSLSVGRRPRRRRPRIRDLLEHQWPDAQPAPEALRTFASALARDTVARLDTIDALVADTAEHWRPERMAVLDRLILRMAVCELMRDVETPHAVVINEALELARTFSTEDAVKFINGMLDAIRKKLNQRP